MIRAFMCLLLLATAGSAQTIADVQFREPTNRYAHHPMGPDVADHGALEITLDDGSRRLIRLPQSRVFEDNAARLADVTGDGRPEVVVVESDHNNGARISVYGIDGLVASSPFIGRRNRWYAIAAIADLDGDGRVEVATVDRPHLRKTMVIWQLEGQRLISVAEYAGVSNHRFGEADIEGGVRNCGAGPELIVARGDWTGLVSLRFEGGILMGQDLGGGANSQRFQQAMACIDN